MHCPECNSPVRFNRCDKCNITVSPDTLSKGTVYGCGSRRPIILETLILKAMNESNWKIKYREIMEENLITEEEVELEVKRRNPERDNRPERGFDDYKKENL